MVGNFVIAAASAAVIALPPAAFAQRTHGTAAEAKAMLMKAIAAVKADEAKALAMVNRGEGGFRDRDLYVFCANVNDGVLVATGNPNLREALGVDIRAAQPDFADSRRIRAQFKFFEEGTPLIAEGSVGRLQ